MSMKEHIPKLKPRYKAVGGHLIGVNISDEKALSGLSYLPTPDDIFVVTYPKSGTTWTQYIVWEILNFGAPPPGMSEMQNEHIPYLELTGQEPIKNLRIPRPIKTHLPYHLQPYHPLAKYIYMARNPRDTCVSYYYFIKNGSSAHNFTNGNLDDFFECFLQGELFCGDWFNHVLSWYVHKDDPNVLFLTYEMMKRDTTENILNIAHFIGKEYGQRLENDPCLLAQIMEYTSFENMKKMEFYSPKKPGGGFSGPPKNEEEAKKFDKVNLFWRGKVGNWKEYLSEDQVTRLDDMILSRPRGQEIATLWDE